MLGKGLKLCVVDEEQQLRKKERKKDRECMKREEE